MSGERDLTRLLAEARPVLDPATYVFVTKPGGALPDDPAVIGMFREAEGLTLIAERGWAEREGLPHIFPCRRITLAVHSSLEAVGLMAAIASALAEAGISANPVAGYFHDHIFVPEEKADRALSTIANLTSS